MPVLYRYTGSAWEQVGAAQSGTSGAILATASLRHASVDTTISTTSTTVVEVDSTNLTVTFTAPASGSVIVTMSGYGNTNSTTYSHIWALRTSAPADVASSAQSLINAVLGTLGTYRCRLTGLTPGNSYTWRWSWKTSSAGTINLFHGPTYGSLLMEVVAI